MIKPLVLLILDGFGCRQADEHNAISSANTPNWDRFWQTYPHCLIDASGQSVGLPNGQMGNSEVGHMHLGAGRIIDQDFTRINKAIEDGTFYQNPTLTKAMSGLAADKTCHILGLLSDGGVHSHEQHLYAAIKLAKQQGVNNLSVHAFLDGRDTPPRSASASLQRLQTVMDETKLGRIASICGRYYAMDRDKRFDRTEKAYRLLTEGSAPFHADNAIAGLEAAYQRDENDEFCQPTIIGDNASFIADGDMVIFMNFRADRARQLTAALSQKDFDGFSRKHRPELNAFVTLTQYAKQLPLPCAFAPQTIKNNLGDVLAQQGLRQLRIAETEKYAHVTFFFNGGVEAPFTNETRELIPSPKVATYDLAPEMSCREVTAKMVDAIEHDKTDVIIANFANADMVGHSGNFAATVKAIECIDDCLGQLEHALQKRGGGLVITSDHGNAEKMHDLTTGQAHTAHTSEPVPFVFVGSGAKVTREMGSLIDVAPTLLQLLDITPPAEMTGRSLLQQDN